MARRHTGRRRGRPRLAQARRRATTRAGRRGEVVIDGGTEELRRRKRLATTRVDVEMNAAGTLFGRGYLDAQQYDTLALIALWLQRAARAWGGRDGSCEGLWATIIGAMTATGFVAAPITANAAWGLADAARRQLMRACRELDGSRDLIIGLAEGRTPPLVVHVLEGRLSAADENQLALLRIGLDRIALRAG
jgi:hypothetical protein